MFNKNLYKIHRGSILKDLNASKTYYFNLGLTPTIRNLNFLERDFEKACYIGPMPNFLIDNIPFSIKSMTILDSNQDSLDYSLKSLESKLEVKGICVDEEEWDYPEAEFDLLISNLTLHWTSNIFKMLYKWFKSLQPNGILAGSFIGEDSLQELRIALSLAEQERTGITQKRVQSMIASRSIEDGINLLNSGNVTLGVDKFSLYFDDIFALGRFLSLVGESSVGSIRKETIIAAGAIYDRLFRERSGEFKGYLPATFDVINFISNNQVIVP